MGLGIESLEKAESSLPWEEESRVYYNSLLSVDKTQPLRIACQHVVSVECLMGRREAELQGFLPFPREQK
jgi:hypothetical protein